MAERVSAMLRDRKFDRVEVVTLLDEMSLEQLTEQFGEPYVITRFAEPQGYWKVGDGRPALADDDPAVMQAIGRCAASRVRDSALALGGIHPSRCAWDEYPQAELLKACDWATWASRYVSDERAVWEGAARSSYSRGLRSGVYENPTHAAFWALPKKDRAYRIEQAAAR